MKTQHNPTLPRLEYVAKQYPDYVSIATMKAWAEAMGAHSLSDRMTRIAMQALAAPSIDAALRMLPRAMEEAGIPANSRYDRYLPWLGREFNRIYKPYRRIAAKLKKPPFPRGVHADLRTVVPPRWHKDYPGEAGEIDSMLRNTRTLIFHFGSLVNWVEAEGIDLNGYEWLEALEASSKWMGDEAIKAEAARIVYKFSDGWTVQELSTKSELKQEGKAMGHCVGSYTIQESEVPGGEPVILDPYTNISAHAASRIFSLRDPGGGSHATLEWSVNDDFVKQLRGKQNAEPKREYLDRMVEFRLRWLDMELAAPEGDVAPFPEDIARLSETTVQGAYIPLWAEGDTYVVFDQVEGVYPLATMVNEFEAHPRAALANASWSAQIPEMRDFWFMWKHFSGTSEMLPPDEMVQWLVDDGLKVSDFKTQSAANPRRVRSTKLSASNPMTELKRRLMR